MKLKAMDVTIEGVEKTFEFDPPIDVGDLDEGPASLYALEMAYTTEVVLVEDDEEEEDW
jgi:hypothetical protein